MISTVKMIPSQRQYPGTMLSVPVHLNALTSNTVNPTRKRVRFNPSVTVQPVDCTMTQEEKARSYNSRDELDMMSLKARTDYAKSKELTTESDTPSSTSHLVVDPALRGLEFRSCPRRVYQKILSTKALLKYQKALASDPLKTNEERLVALAMASSKLNQRATLVAIETARLDSKQVLDYDYLIPISNEPVLLTPFPGQKKQRRLSSEASDSILTRNFPKPGPGSGPGQKKRRRLHSLNIFNVPIRQECK